MISERTQKRLKGTKQVLLYEKNGTYQHYRLLPKKTKKAVMKLHSGLQHFRQVR